MYNVFEKVPGGWKLAKTKDEQIAEAIAATTAKSSFNPVKMAKEMEADLRLQLKHGGKVDETHGTWLEYIADYLQTAYEEGFNDATHEHGGL